MLFRSIHVKSQFREKIRYYPEMQECYNPLLSNFRSIMYNYLSSGRLRKVKNKRKFQTFSSKSGRGHLREVVSQL